MEAFDGVALLATNLRHQLDDAFSRRLDFVVHFPFPEAEERLRMWERAWPDTVPRAEIDLAALAGMPLSGAGIANAARAAAFLAAADGGVVLPAHVREGLRREYQKLGRALTDAELPEAAPA
jgi:SpoVK/Ycf46/Vps4 family AAA+-type ATPase